MSEWLECQLCPKYCRIEEGRTGDCGIRMNLDGKLLATTYGVPCSVHMDPIEKKPLFHFIPGTAIFSLATVGCNLHCRNCQNHTISQAIPEDVEGYRAPPDKLVESALRQQALSIAYTYTEPLVYYEYTYDCCVMARERGVKNVLVTAGYVNEKPLRQLLPYVDAANVDLKAFSEDFYRDNCGGSLKPVLRNLEIFVEMGVWLEITNLIIPSLNDDGDEISRMCKWIVHKLGEEVPVHFSRFHPQYKMTNLPPTPAATLEDARERARAEGLKHVYVGNLRSRTGENTYCPNPGCRERERPLVERIGYHIMDNRLANGRCPACGTRVAGVWNVDDNQFSNR